MRAKEGKFHSLLLRAGRTRWPRAGIVAGSIFFVAALSLFLFIRRATGALTAPLQTSQLVATATVMILWALIIREFTAKQARYFWLSLFTMLLVAIGCSFPVARVVDWVVWLPTIGCIAMLPLTTRLKLPSLLPHRASLIEVNAFPETVLQHLTRFRTTDGKNAIRGTLMAEFVAGERQTTLYVGFCPPFELLPQVEANAAGAFEADIKAIQVLHNGAQLDVRLSEPAEEAVAVSVEFFAIEGEAA